jgi:hypothetical protein
MGTVPSIWENGTARWDPIVIYFLDAGLYCPSDNPALVKFLHVACYQSNLPYVEKLLDYSVNHTARAVRSGHRDYVFGSALHVVTVMGHTDMALCL